MKRYLVLVSLFLLFGAVTASAQVTYQLTSTPTFVIDTARADVLGSIRLTAQNAVPVVSGTVNVLYQNVACDNDYTSGVTLTATGNLAAAGVVTIGEVLNTSPSGCIVSFQITNTGATASLVGDTVTLGGARGRIDLTTGIPTGGSIQATLNATPSSSSLFTAPTTVVVGTLQPGLIVSATLVTRLQCIGGGNPTLTIKEGYNAPFVQNVVTALATVIPATPRPLFGASRNTWITIQVLTLPTGVTIAWPATVTSQLNAGVFAAGVAGSQLQLLAGSTSASATYEYACGHQGTCDVNQETFLITPTVTVLTTAAFGTATVQATLAPPLLAADATSLLPVSVGSVPLPAAPKPRYKTNFLNVPADPFVTTGPCRTNLLFPWVANVAGYDTGIAIANTSKDPFGAVVGAIAQNGTCVLNAFPRATPENSGGTPPAAIAFTTPNTIKAGDTFTLTLADSDNNPTLNGFVGYIIAVCNFQYGHGFAFITSPFPGDPVLSQGYVALVIPDPAVVGARGANMAKGVAQEGEGLGQ